MARVIRLPAAQPAERPLLAELRTLVAGTASTWEECTRIMCAPDKTWDDYDDWALQCLVNLTRASIIRQQQAALAPVRSAAGAGRKAQVAHFPGTTPAPAPKAAPDAAARTKPQTQADKRAAHRKAMIVKIHMALPILCRKLPHFDDAVYRAILFERFGAGSSTELNNEQLHSLLLHLRDIGGDAMRHIMRRGSIGPKPATLKHDATGQGRIAMMRKIEALLAEKGAAEGTSIPWAYAEAILRRQTGGVTRFEDADQRQLRGVIAALCKDAKRKGRYVG